MCSRFTITFTIQDAIKEFRLNEDKVRFRFEPNYNAAPSQQIPILFEDESGDGSGDGLGDSSRNFLEKGRLVLDSAKWGLIPHWAKDAKMAYSMINARAESVSEKPSYKDAFSNGRCLIPASGFIEWEKAGVKKIPHYFSFKNMPIFTFAGIRSDWKDPENGQIISTCSIITTAANKTVSHIHDRMPVILSRDNRKSWLSKKTSVDSLKVMLVPYPEDSFRETILSTRINSPRVNDKALLEPVNGDKQQRLFLSFA